MAARALTLLLLCLAGHHTLAHDHDTPGPLLPMVINTWGGPFTAATDAAYLALAGGRSALDAVETGCATCERDRCDGSVGYGGSPDERCETTLDALIMDGTTMDAGAVGAIRRVRDAVAAARLVMEHTSHTMLVGDQATLFAAQNGLAVGSLTTPESASLCRSWRRDRCQPNYRVDVAPDPATSCGPYRPLEPPAQRPLLGARQASHDTISQIAIHPDGSMAAATTTNGASHKVPGRVGDGPIVGSGSYVDGHVGGCGATGDGDIMMRFLPCYQAVENLRQGMGPTEAAEDAVNRMVRRFPDLMSGLVVVDAKGRHGGAASGWTFTYAYRAGGMNATEVVTVEPVNG